MEGSDFQAPLPMSALLHVFMGARLPRTYTWISLVTACSQCQARHGLGPRGVPAPLAIAQRLVTYRRDKTVGHQPKRSGLNTFRVGITRYLCTSPAFVPTHRRARYRSRRKARYWARGSR